MRKSWDYKEILEVLILFVVSAVYLYFVKLGIGSISSDETTGILMAKDLFVDGNFLLSDWYFSTGITTIQLFFATIICNIFGYSYTTLYIIAAVNYAILINILAYIAMVNSTYPKYKRIWIAVFVVLLTINPKSMSVMNTCTHTLIYAVCILIIYILYKKYMKQSGLVVYITAGIIIGLLAAFNCTMLYYSCIPIVFLGIMYIVLKLGNRRQSCYLIICGSISIVICKLVQRGWEALRAAEINGMGEYFVTQDNIVNNIVQVFSNILYEFGINIWGKKLLSVDTLKAVVGFLTLICIKKILFQYSRLREDRKLLVVAVLSIGIVNLLAYGASSIPSYSSSTHLMELFGWCFVGAAGICLGNIELEESTGIKKAVLLAVAVVFFTCNIPQLAFRQEKSSTFEITEYLQLNGYEKGFATYWEYGNIVFESGMQMEVAPIAKFYNEEYPDGVVGGWQFMTKKEWVEQEGQFVVVARENPYSVTAQDVVDVYGIPTNQIEMNACDILLYDQGITMKVTAR